MIEGVPAIHSKQLNAQPDGSVTVTCLTLPAGVPAGSVYSIQPGGEIQFRGPGTNGPYEKAMVNGNALAFAPQGKDGPAYIVPFVLSIPNV